MQHPFPRDTIPAHQGPPASGEPIRDFVRHAPPGLTDDGNYLVVPVWLMTEMDVPFQQHLAGLLDQFARRYAHYSWPAYRVTPTVRRALSDCDEEQLAEVGALAEHAADDSGLVYRDRQTLQPLEPHRETAVSCRDPLLTPQNDSADLAQTHGTHAPVARPDDYPTPW